MEPVRYSPLDPPRHRVDAVRAGDLIYIAGMTAYDRSADVQQQTRETLQKLDIVLEQVGSSRHHLVMANVYLNDTNDYDLFNEIWNDWIPEGEGPARVCTGTNLAVPGLRVEVSLVAAPVD